ncbi:hypothetical protein [Endozoicomonas sp. ALB091]|uniref:hypothetical protein n=1 Tax=Endozoicomonas sp. ALB091 TaxID=3403073 RepID=UPI003BB6AF1D
MTLAGDIVAAEAGGGEVEIKVTYIRVRLWAGQAQFPGVIASQIESVSFHA